MKSPSKLVWKRLSDYAMALYRDGERLPFTVCCYGAGELRRFEAWDCRVRPRQIKTGLIDYKDAQAIVELAMKVQV